MSHLSVSRLIRSLLIVLPLAASAIAQNIQNPQSAVDNSMRSNLHVDESTGAMQLRIPLGEYRGRGEAGLPITLNYSSKLWNIKHLSTLPCNGEPVSSYYAEYAKGSASGWTSTLGWFLPTEDLAMESYEGQTQKPATVGNPNLFRIMRKFVTLPDGSRHELRRDDALHSFGDNQSGVYYAVDGSRLRWDWSDSGNNTLYLPNGSRIVSINYSRQYIDRNGNLLSFDSNSSTWTDTLGRSLVVPIPGNTPTAGQYTYSMPGVNGTPLYYTLVWRNLADALTVPGQPLEYKGDAVSADCTLGWPQPNTLFSTMDAQQKILRQSIFNPVVLYRIIMPHDSANLNPLVYTFTYNLYGELDKIVYPTGGSESFSYDTLTPLGGQLDDGTFSQGNRGVFYRGINDGSTTQTWQYNDGNNFETGVDPATNPRWFVSPDGTVTKTWYYRSRNSEIKYGFDDARTGMAREERVYNSSGTMLRRTVYQLAEDGPWSGGYATATRNARVVKKLDIILDTGGNALASATEMTYDADLNVISTRHYDYVSITQSTGQSADYSSIPNGTLLRTDETDYLTGDANYSARNLLSLPTATRVKNGAGTIMAQSSIYYDEAAYPLLGYGAITNWSDPGTSARGNPTTSGAWNNVTGTYLQTHAQYDQSGSVRNSWDAKGNQSQVEYSSAYAYAYPTLTRSAVPDPSGAYGSTTALVATIAYDYSTGVVTSQTDANGQTTSYSYDGQARLTQVSFPDGGRTTRAYVDAHPCGRYVETRTLLDSSGRETDSYQFFDALDRPKRAFSYENQDTNNPYLTVDTQYDSMGRAWRSSNPYRSSGCTAAVNPSGQWTATSFDALSRVLSVTTPDNAVVSTAYSGATVTVTDQGGKQRRSVTDGLGRLKEVYEDPNGVNYLTSYGYDALDNLTAVVQGVQTRTFVYDSLKRLSSATNPESGTISYQYDSNGNLTRKTDALGIYIDYTYDALNRNRLIDYSDATPDSYRQYDMAGNGKGRINQTWQSGTTTAMTNVDQYDAVGRPLIQRQRYETGGVWSGSYQVERTYDLAGHVKTQTYPSGHTVTYNYDAAGRLGDKDASNLAFTGNLGDGVARTYAAGILYSPFGGMSKERFGTDTALYSKQFYNVRGQLAEIRVGTYSTDDGWWNRGAILNVYSALAGWTESREDNNGNLRKQMLYIPNDDQISGYVDSAFFYDYDSLNRLDVAREVVGGQNSWVQDYDYDRYGNRTINQTNTWGAGINKKQFTVNTANNRLGVPAGQSGEMIYNGAGNLTRDTYSGAAVTRAYDAENRMTSETQANNYVAGSYSYSADGQRVRRTVGGQPSAVTTWQIYGIDGELLAEYAANAAPASPQKEYGYRNGQLLITAEAPTGQPPSLNPQNVTWTNVSSQVQATGNSIQKVSGTSEWDAGAVSTQTIAAGDGYMEFTPGEAVTWRMAGLGSNNTSAFYADIEYALFMVGSGDLYIYESGNSRGYFGSYAAADRLKVAVENGVVKYYRNSTLLYTSTVTPQYPLQVDTSLNTVNSGVYSVVITSTTPSASGNIQWLVADQLGTPRMVFDKTGSLAGTKRHDYLPFGEELYAGQGVRTLTRGYGASDAVRQKFTSKERDNETGLDYFLARYYSSTSGRFTSPDPIFISDKQTYNPQLWNLYNYVGSNPLNATDPTGMKLVRLGQHTDEWIDNRSKQINQQLNDPKSKLTNSQRAKLGDELDTITQEKQGNAVAREAISQLNAIGEGANLKVSDFTLSTDTANDFMSDPRFVQGNRAQAQKEANETDKNADMFFIHGYSNQIFINTKGMVGKAFGSGNPYSGSVLADTTVFAATEMEHERNHRDGRSARARSEGAAYAEQSRILWKFGPDAFKDKNYYVQVSLQYLGYAAKYAHQK